MTWVPARDGDRIFGPMCGLPSWRVEQGHGSFMTLEFGEPHVEVREVASRPFRYANGEQTRFRRRSADVNGEWHLWIYMCGWSISVEDQQLAHSESDRVTIARALAVLNGQALTRYEAVADDNPRRRFAFDLGCNLEIWPFENDEPAGAELWTLYEPTGSTVSMFATGEYKRSQRSQ
jgi:hypothetical protein